MRHRAYIGLGANLPSPAGGPERTLAAAIEDLRSAGEVAAQSPLFRTEPMEYEDQPPFVNAVALLETDADPERLLQFLFGLERSYGRHRSADAAKGPRTLDLDLLLYDDLVLSSPELTLPHPALAHRRFVLAPLAAIAPQLRHPVLGATIAELLAALPQEGPNRKSAVRELHSGAGL